MTPEELSKQIEIDFKQIKDLDDSIDSRRTVFDLLNERWVSFNNLDFSTSSEYTEYCVSECVTTFGSLYMREQSKIFQRNSYIKRNYFQSKMNLMILKTALDER